MRPLLDSETRRERKKREVIESKTGSSVQVLRTPSMYFPVLPYSTVYTPQTDSKMVFHVVRLSSAAIGPGCASRIQG